MMRFSSYSINVQGMMNAKTRQDLLGFVSAFNPSFLCIQETNLDIKYDLKLNFPNYNSYYNSKVARGSGTCIFLKNYVSVYFDKVIIPGKLQIVACGVGFDKFRIYNVHVPHSQPDAFALLTALKMDLVSATHSEEIILAGDWNFVENRDLDLLHAKWGRVGLVNEFVSLRHTFDVTDAFRYLNPIKMQFTHIGYQSHKPQSRIDRIYVSKKLLKSVTEVNHYPFSGDHAIVEMIFYSGSVQSSPYWKMDLSMLADELFCSEFDKRLDAFIASPIKSISTYEMFKFNLKQFCMTQSRLRSHKIKVHLSEISQNMSMGDGNNADSYHELLDGLQIGGGMSRFANPDVQNRRIPTEMSEITISRGLCQLNDNAKMDLVHSFYSARFSHSQTRTSGISEYLDDIHRIPDEMSTAISNPFSIEEVESAISRLAPGKSPGFDGFDGFPSEIY